MTMPAPLVAANVDLRDFSYMPLDVVRLRDSRLVSHATGEGFRCAVLLWCVAWHQIPAGSLPNDDVQLAQYAGFGRMVREFQKVREDAMHGWVLCSDGRWYHPTVAEKAREAWTERLKQRWRTELARIKKAAQRAKTTAAFPTFDQWLEHFNATGTEQFSPRAVPGDELGTGEGTEDDCPGDVAGETASKGREGKGSITPDSRSHTEGSSGGTEAGRACLLMRQAGCISTNPAHPELLEVIAGGVTPEALAATVAEAMTQQPPIAKPFVWAIRTAKNRHQAAQQVAGGTHAAASNDAHRSGTPARRETASERSARINAEHDRREAAG